MATPTYVELSDFIGETIPGGEAAHHAQAVIGVVQSMVSAYTRGVGFDDGPNDDLRAVIPSATARRLSNLNGVRSEAMEPFSVQYDSGFSWTVAESTSWTATGSEHSKRTFRHGRTNEHL